MAQAAAEKPVTALKDALGDRAVVLVGLMGAGKSSVGRRLATRLGLAFVDADTEIETAAGMTIPEIFDRHGEPYFRSGEARVIARLLDRKPRILATGGGAYMNAETRRLIGERSVSVWLKADLDTLMRRVRRRGDRPLLRQADPEAVMRRLMDERYPVYAEADIVVVSKDSSHEETVNDVIDALRAHLVDNRAEPDQ